MISTRKSHILAYLILFLFILPAISFAGQFKGIRVHDGDTIKAEGCDIEIKVRLVGIDAPEISRKKREPGQPYSQQAKKYLASLVLNKVVAIKGYGLDRYNRILGVVFLGDKNINVEMIKAGLAELYRGEPPRGLDLTPFWRAEKEAKEAKRGMWSLGDKYISPREWRRLRRERQ